MSESRNGRSPAEVADAALRAVANLVPELLWRADTEGDAVWFNDRWYAYTGQTPAQAFGLGWIDAVHAEDRDATLAQWRAAVAEDQDTFRCEYRLRAGDGSYRRFLSRGESIRDPAGRAVSWFAATIDVEEVRLATEEIERSVAERTQELKQANTELARSLAERNSLRRQLTAAEEDERRRLARELHDQLGQNLTALALGLASVRGALSNGEAADARLGRLEELARTLMRDARYLALELRPPELDDVGLASAVETYVAEWKRRYAIPVDLVISGFSDHAPPVSPDAASATYRIIQESLTNVAKHANAQHVSIVLERSAGLIRLAFEDDGCGFDAETVLNGGRAEGRFGLAGIQERAALADGSAIIESAPGSGTSIFVRLSE